MNTLEIILLVVAALPLLYRAWNGWRYGATMEFRHLLITIFAVFIAIRYWQPWVETISTGLTFDPRWIATGSFLALYGIAAAVAGYVVRLRSQAYQSVKPDYVNRTLGLLAGAFSGALLGGCLVWLAAVAVPGRFEEMPQAQSVAAWPRDVFQFVETRVAGVEPASPSLTRYPHVTIVETPVDAQPGTIPEGAVLMQLRGRIAWQ